MKPTKINPFMYKLLIEREFNNFTVSEFRDELMKVEAAFSDRNEARTYAHRQVGYFERKGWLVRIGFGRTTRYLKTNAFIKMEVAPREKNSRYQDKSNDTCDSPEYHLRMKKKLYEKELTIAKGEVEEFQSLLTNFPQSNEVFESLFQEAQERAAKLYGKINALSKVISS